ncbi:acyltransferase [Marinomonas epiphytica]
MFHNLRAIMSFVLLMINTLFWFLPIMLLALVKCLFPFSCVQHKVNGWLDKMATLWIAFNNLNHEVLGRSYLELDFEANLLPGQSYMLIANHQSWVDILVLQRVFNRKIPFIKFFLKQELIWVPFIGLAWWALDFPFMKRYSQEKLKENPALKGADIEATRKACAKFGYAPTAIMNFLEGTRFTRDKHLAQSSPYKNLLKPKAGGLSFALTAMEGKIDALLDVSIVYPKGVPSLWQYLSGEVTTIKVHVRSHVVTPEWLGDYQLDDQYRDWFQKHVNQLWEQKDQWIEKMHSQ